MGSYIREQSECKRKLKENKGNIKAYEGQGRGCSTAMVFDWPIAKKGCRGGGSDWNKIKEKFPETAPQNFAF